MGTRATPFGSIILGSIPFIGECVNSLFFILHLLYLMSFILLLKLTVTYFELMIYWRIVACIVKKEFTKLIQFI